MPLEFDDPESSVATTIPPLPTRINPGHDATITPSSESTALESDCHALSVAAQQRRASYIRWQAGLDAPCAALDGSRHRRPDPGSARRPAQSHRRRADQVARRRIRRGHASGAATGQRYAGERSKLRVALSTALGRLGNHEDHQVLLRLAHMVAVLPPHASFATPRGQQPKRSTRASPSRRRPSHQPGRASPRRRIALHNPARKSAAARVAAPPPGSFSFRYAALKYSTEGVPEKAGVGYPWVGRRLVQDHLNYI